jgi:hypothetical protein
VARKNERVNPEIIGFEFRNEGLRFREFASDLSLGQKRVLSTLFQKPTLWHYYLYSLHYCKQIIA